WGLLCSLIVGPERTSQPSQLRKKVWHLHRDHVPDDIQVDGEVGVAEHIPQAGYAAPLNIPLASSDIIRDALGGLAQDLKVSHDGVRHHRADSQALTIQPGAVLRDSLTRLDHVVNEQRHVTRHAATPTRSAA